jgi:hypothetical protein
MMVDENRNVLSEQSTIFLHVRGLTTPVQFLQLMWNSVESYLVRKNRDLDIFVNNHRSLPTKLTISSLRKFFGTSIMQGATGATSTDLLYAKTGVRIEFPGKDEQLPQKAFGMLGKNLEFDLSEVHSLLIYNFKYHISPGHFLTIDEARVRETRFSSEFKTFNPNKPARWAVESKTLSDSTMYLIDFIDPTTNSKPTPSEAAFQFLQWLNSSNTYHHVCVDSNFFNLDDIRRATTSFKRIKVTASVKKVRPSFLFKDALNVDLPPGKTRVAASNEIPHLVAASTHSNKIINLVSNGFQVCNINEGDIVPAERRMMLDTYDTHKGYTDQFDHLVSNYEISHRWKTDKMNLLMGWFQYALTNAYIIYINSVEDPITHRNFRFSVAEAFLNSEDWNSRSTRGRK